MASPSRWNSTSEFFQHLRDEIRFDSLDALKAEIRRNADDARTYFANKA